jgi:tetratricopeptide (TPR) repeat protein
MKEHSLCAILFFFLLSCGGSLIVKGDDSLQDGMIDNAIITYTEALNSKDSTPEEKKTAAARIADCYAKKGHDDLRKGNTAAAIANFEKSGNNVALANLTEIYYTRGISEYQSKNYSEAIKLLEKSAAAADKAKLPRKEDLGEKAADSYFRLGESEFSANNFAGAKKYYEPLVKNYGRDTYPEFTVALHRLFVISDSEKDDDAALRYLKTLRKADPGYRFDNTTTDIFIKILAGLTRNADIELMKKNFDGASAIIEKATVLPVFDELKQKQFKSRIAFLRGKDMILANRIDNGLVQFDKARGIDAKISAEIGDFVNTDFVNTAKELRRKKEYKAAVEKLLVALRITPGNRAILGKALPDAYYDLGNSCYMKKEYKAALDAIKKGLALDKNHKELKALFTRFDQTANAARNATKRELPPIAAFVDEQSRNGTAPDNALGTYAGKKVKWQFKVIGTEEIRGKICAKLLFGKTVLYGLPTDDVDARRFASECEENKVTKEAVVEGTIRCAEELRGERYIVINVTGIRFVEILE